MAAAMAISEPSAITFISIQSERTFSGPKIAFWPIPGAPLAGTWPLPNTVPPGSARTVFWANTASKKTTPLAVRNSKSEWNAAVPTTTNSPMNGSPCAAVGWKYGYDSLAQVNSGKKHWNDGSFVAGQQFEYGFDDIGNRTSAKRGGDS